MGDNFFDESVLVNESPTEMTIENPEDIRYNLRFVNGAYQFSIEINEERLNSSEIQSLVKMNDSSKFLTDFDVALMNYISHRLGSVQTIYRVLNDISLIIDYLKNSKFKTLFNDEEINFSNECYKLEINMYFDENSNIVMDVVDRGIFVFGSEKVYFLKNGIMYNLDERLSIKFYKELFEGHNKFSIETFFSFRNTILGKIKEVHNLNISDEVANLSNENMLKVKAPIVLEIGRTSHFIVLQFKYKVGNEYFPIEEYVYAETLNWVDKKTVIKIAKEGDSLVEYIPDETISEEIFKDIFEGSRIRFSQNPKSPFLLMIPVSNLDNFVKRVLPKAEKEFDVVYKDGQKLNLEDSNVEFEVDTNLNTRINMFEFKVKFKVGSEYFDLDFMKELMTKNKKYVQMKDGSTVNVENIREINKWIEFLDKFEFAKNDNSYKSKSHTALELDEFLKDIKSKTVKSNEEYRDVLLELKEKRPVSEVKLPSSVDNILRDYQKEGVYWLYFLQKYGFGGILADEMGLGKTIQTLTVLAMNKGEYPHIVVCPKSLIYNWENEIKKYFPDMKVLIVDKDSEKRKRLIEESKDYDVVITSYSMLQKDFREYLDNGIEFNYMVLDEAHYVKNMKTLSAKAVRVVPSQRKVLLTGTPLENNLEELYGTFDLVMPGYLGTKLDFRRDFVSKIERNNMIALEILQAKIRPFILRRTKKEVLKELPDKQEQIVYNEMTNKQVAVYQEVLNRVKMEVNELVEKQGFSKSRIQILSALLKLRQVCNHPSLIDPSFRGDLGISGKHEQFLELLEEITDSGEKVLVFSQFTSMLDIFETDLRERKIEYLRLDGSTKDRQDVVDRFNDDEKVKVFLISLKAGGVGLNLTSASAVFLYDPWWNPMAEKQAVDRAHRIGQTKKVNIYKFITKDSIEEKILKLQERKGNLFENLVTEDKGFIKRLEWEDLMELFD